MRVNKHLAVHTASAAVTVAVDDGLISRLNENAFFADVIGFNRHFFFFFRIDLFI